MRTFAGICLGISMFAAPAFAQDAGVSVSTSPSSFSRSADAPAISKSSGSFGFLDGVSLRRAPERPVSVVAPFETEQLGLTWKPGSKWGVTLDLKSRPRNEVLPREELSAGAYYQITPRFRFGGGVTLNGESLRSAAEGWQEKDGEAGVRIESAFSF